MTHPVAHSMATKFVPSEDLKVGDRILASKYYRLCSHESDGPVQGQVTHYTFNGCIVQPLNLKASKVAVMYSDIIHRFKS